jgi:hypothetical protein
MRRRLTSSVQGGVAGNRPGQGPGARRGALLATGLLAAERVATGLLVGGLRSGGLLAGGLLGCISPQPRFPPDVQRAINRDDMRRLETSDLIVYYPQGTRAEALAIAARLEYCRRELARVEVAKNRFATEKPVFVLPRLPLNNAYVQPTLAGNEQVSVVPQYNTSNLFISYGIPPDPGTIGCHEMVHDQSFRQVTGVAAGLRTVFGDVYSPQLGLDSWWQEGLAVYYETKLQGGGRLWTKYTDGIFAAGMQEVSTLHGGYLHPEKREVSTGAPYLIGARFVDYLARRYGERRLWRVIDEQSDAFAFPFAISNEFRRVYGKPLATLIEDFEADTRRRYPRRERPEEQRTLLRLGRSATLARAPGGREVIASEDLDEPARLIVRDAGGKLLVDRRLTDLGIGRRLIAPRVPTISGLSLTADGAHAYFVALDPGALFTEARLMHLDIEADALEVVAADIGGAGGSISPDGRHYYFNRPIGEALQLAFALFRLELASGRIEQLTQPEPRHYHADPVVSPDGRRLLVTEVSDAGIRLAVYAAADGQRLGDVAAPEGMAFDASWVDADRVVFAGTAPDRMQIFETDLRTQQLRRLTDAPYLAVSPFSNGLTLRFLNRDGWNWTLDEVYHPSLFAPPASRVASAEPASPVEPRTSFAYARRRPIADREPEEVSDEPYSGFDGLLLPNAWGPWLAFDAEGDAAYGLQLTGGDRLGWQRWAIGGAWSPDARLPSARLSYLNSMLAPVSLRLDVAYSGRREDVFDLDLPGEEPVEFIDGTTTSLRLEEITARLTLGTRLYDSLELELGGRYDSVRYERDPSAGFFGEDLRFAGPPRAHRLRERRAHPLRGRAPRRGHGGHGHVLPGSLLQCRLRPRRRPRPRSHGAAAAPLAPSHADHCRPRPCPARRARRPRPAAGGRRRHRSPAGHPRRIAARRCPRRRAPAWRPLLREAARLRRRRAVRPPRAHRRRHVHLSLHHRLGHRLDPEAVALAVRATAQPRPVLHGGDAPGRFTRRVFRHRRFARARDELLALAAVVRAAGHAAIELG